ncbi:hypothetical protein CEXT_679181, partial [Caerostris extrusa]
YVLLRFHSKLLNFHPPSNCTIRKLLMERDKRMPTEVTPQKLKEFTYRRRTTSKSRPVPTSIEETKISKNRYQQPR